MDFIPGIVWNCFWNEFLVTWEHLQNLVSGPCSHRSGPSSAWPTQERVADCTARYLTGQISRNTYAESMDRSSTVMPRRWYLLMGLVSQVSLLSDTTEWNLCVLASSTKLNSQLKTWGIEVPGLVSLLKALWWRLSQIGWRQAVMVFSLMWQLRASKSTWPPSVI